MYMITKQLKHNQYKMEFPSNQDALGQPVHHGRRQLTERVIGEPLSVAVLV